MQVFTRAILFGLAAVFLVGACSSPNMGDLKTYVDSVKNKKTAAITPLPEYPPNEVFIYPAESRPNPFMPQQDASQAMNPPATETRAENCESPKGFRNAQDLERYPLDALEMVGSIQIEEELKALVKDPSGVVHEVANGHYLGQNNGKVIYIDEHNLELREMVPDGRGCYTERQTSLALKHLESPLAAEDSRGIQRPTF